MEKKKRGLYRLSGRGTEEERMGDNVQSTLDGWSTPFILGRMIYPALFIITVVMHWMSVCGDMPASKSLCMFCVLGLSDEFSVPGRELSPARPIFDGSRPKLEKNEAPLSPESDRDGGAAQRW
jgi:hypothetical protein